MLTIRHSYEKANTTKWIGPSGRLISLEFSARRDAVPAWLGARLRAYAKRFDWGDDCTDPWTILRRISPGVSWKGQWWGTATLASGVEVFVSDVIHWTQHSDVDAAADDLDVSYAFCPDGRFAFAGRAGVWRERGEYASHSGGQ